MWSHAENICAMEPCKPGGLSFFVNPKCFHARKLTGVFRLGRHLIHSRLFSNHVHPLPIIKRVPSIFTALSLLACVPVLYTSHTMTMWKITLAVTEYGHRLALLPFAMAIFLMRRHRINSLLAFVAAGILCLPLFQAWQKARTLPNEMSAAFKLQLPSNSSSPLSFFDLFFGGMSLPVPAQTIEYANNGGGPCNLLFFPSQTRKPAPCIIVIHGGGWDSGSAEEFLEWNHYWASEGYAVAAIEYRLAPRWHWPAQREDTASALAFLKTNAGKLGIDASRFVLLGRSAGGQIAGATAYALHDPAVRGCILMYAPDDMPFAWKYADPSDVLDTPKLLGQYLGGSAEAVSAAYLSASATLIADAASPPTLMVHGNRDIIVWNRQSERLSARLNTLNVPHYYLALPWATHGLDYPFHGPGAELTRYVVDAFLNKVVAEKN